MTEGETEANVDLRFDKEIIPESHSLLKVLTWIGSILGFYHKEIKID